VVSCPDNLSNYPIDNGTSVVYPACAVTRAMAKQATRTHSIDEVSGTEHQIELANTILDHSRENMKVRL